MSFDRAVFGCSLLLALVTSKGLWAESWPTYRHDPRRSAVSDEQLSFPLRQAWVRKSNQPPQTAWSGPAKWDAWTGNSGLQSMRNFDPCFFVTVDNGHVFFGSSVDDAVHALDASSGEELWVYITGAAVRLPPTLYEGKAYFGSDDGVVYCCDSRTGKLVWKLAAAPSKLRVTSDRKLISLWPIRTGVLVRDGMACFGASLVPWKPSYLWQVDALTGKADAERCFRTEVSEVTLQGALLASDERIYVPQGRAAPLAFNSSDGASIGPIGEAGGVFCILTEDEMLLTGPQNQKSPTDQMRVADALNRERLATFSGANRIIVDGQKAWVPTAGQLKLLDRSLYVSASVDAGRANRIVRDKKITDPAVKEKAKADMAAALERQKTAWRWGVECPPPSELIKAGDTVFVGLDDEVRAYHAGTGERVWASPVEGTAHGLAVAEGRLFVSTGRGHVYAFEQQP